MTPWLNRGVEEVGGGGGPGCECIWTWGIVGWEPKHAQQLSKVWAHSNIDTTLLVFSPFFMSWSFQTFTAAQVLFTNGSQSFLLPRWNRSAWLLHRWASSNPLYKMPPQKMHFYTTTRCVTTISRVFCLFTHRADWAVDCGQLVHSRSRSGRSRSPPTCSMGELCVQILALWGCVTWADGCGWMAQHRIRTLSRHLSTFKINKRRLCSLSITYPTLTTGHSICHPDISKPLTQPVPHLPCWVRPGIHPWRRHLSDVPDAISCECLPTQVCSNDKLQSDRDRD